ncbi:MAG TPA: hypothetical protein VNT03_08295 [Baekduia sp.]|nr:hypothetical protein [Baekduia sp.]
MSDRSRTFVVPLALLLAVAISVAVLHGQRSSSSSSAAARDGRAIGEISAQERAATFTFDPATAEADRTAFLTAVAHARPEAQALIAAVDGLVDVHVVVTEAGTVGLTESRGDRYAVSVDLGLVSRHYGQRGIDRTVLHELGHVIDFALVPQALDDRLDATIPRGYGCDESQSGACAQQRERFAESFAKWATGDIGVDLYLGYKVPPPDDLAAWGAPLAALLGSGSVGSRE